jgi:hypothetical protein
MSAEAELIISPEIAEGDLHKAFKSVEKKFDVTAKHLETGLKKRVHDGLVDGAEDGAKKSKGVFRRMFTSMKSMGKSWGQQTFGSSGGDFAAKGMAGAKVLAGSTFGFLLAGVMDSISRSDEARNLIAEALGGAGDLALKAQSAANAGGMGMYEFAQQSTFFQRNAGLERGDYEEQLTATARTLAENKGNEAFGAYRNMSAGDAIKHWLATYTTGEYKKDMSQGVAIGGMFGIDENTAAKMMLAASKLGGTTANERLGALQTANQDQSIKYENILHMELVKGEEYRKQQFDNMLSFSEQSLEKMSTNAIKAVSAFDKLNNQHNQNLLSNIQSDMKIAIQARQAMEEIRISMNGGTKMFLDAVMQFSSAVGVVGAAKSMQGKYFAPEPDTAAVNQQLRDSRK